eukprot:6515126-Prorocentrum_lima.AAC.1
MTSSLVGSEMCIRDRKTTKKAKGISGINMEAHKIPEIDWSHYNKEQAVSYTHLTLPTICSV